MTIKNSRIRLRYKREKALELVVGYIQKLGNIKLGSKDSIAKAKETRLKTLTQQKDVLEQRIKMNARRRKSI